MSHVRKALHPYALLAWCPHDFSTSRVRSSSAPTPAGYRPSTFASAPTYSGGGSLSPALPAGPPAAVSSPYGVLPNTQQQPFVPAMSPVAPATLVMGSPTATNYATAVAPAMAMSYAPAPATPVPARGMAMPPLMHATHMVEKLGCKEAGKR